jgi:hypothetical protein
MSKENSSHSRLGQVMAGLVLMSAGVLLLLAQLGQQFPWWLLSWPMIPIVLGLVVAAGSLFRNPAWILLLGVGSVFLANEIAPEIGIFRFIWPTVLIGMALWMIFGRSPKWDARKWNEHYWDKESWKQEMKDWKSRKPRFSTETTDSTVPPINGQPERFESVSVFGSTRKTVFSKNFIGGELISVLGSAEIDLSQADIQGRVSLEVTQVLGSAKLIVPPHWQVITSEIVAVFGGIEDNRIPQAGSQATDKVLVLTGTSVLGGIEIQNFG